MTTVFLVHGGLWEGIDAERFWHRPGVTAALRGLGVDVLGPDRLPRATDWNSEADHLASTLHGPATVIAGSNGCSAAVRLAVGRPALVMRLVLAWPATAGDPAVDAFIRDALDTDIDPMLRGETLRGVTNAELRALDMPLAVLPAEPENLMHQRRTADELVRLTGATELPGCPEPPRPAFQVAEFVDSVLQFGLSR